MKMKYNHMRREERGGEGEGETYTLAKVHNKCSGVCICGESIIECIQHSSRLCEYVECGHTLSLE
jgi:hypothetical protein